MALTYSTLRKPASPQVVDPSTGRMREEWQLFFDQLIPRLNGAVDVLSSDVAPADAQYIVGAASSGLSAERVVTNTTTVTWDLATAGQAKANVPNGVVDAGTLDGMDTSASGNRYGVVPFIAADGVMEVGRYIDFHNSDGDTGDAANRLETNGGTVGLFESPNLGGLKRMVSLTNSSLAQGDVIYYDGTNFVRLAPGTSGQFLKTNGAAANPAWAAAGGWTYASEVNVNSGTAVTLVSSLPSTVREIEIMLRAVSTNTNGADMVIRLGDSGGFETSGYTSTSTDGAGADTTATAGFLFTKNSDTTAAGNVENAIIRLYCYNDDSSKWHMTASSLLSNATDQYWATGRKDLSAIITQIQITTITGTANFDGSGTASVRYR